MVINTTDYSLHNYRLATACAIRPVLVNTGIRSTWAPSIASDVCTVRLLPTVAMASSSGLIRQLTSFLVSYKSIKRVSTFFVYPVATLGIVKDHICGAYNRVHCHRIGLTLAFVPTVLEGAAELLLVVFEEKMYAAGALLTERHLFKKYISIELNGSSNLNNTTE